MHVRSHCMNEIQFEKMFLLACQMGYVTTMEILLSCAWEMDRHIFEGFLLACDTGRECIVQKLHKTKRILIEHKFKNSLSPFYLANRKSHFDVVRVLIAIGFMVEVENVLKFFCKWDVR